MADGVDVRGFRGALGAFATGVTIVTTRDPAGRDVGLTANSFSSVSLEPPMVLWSLAKTSSSLAAFNQAGHFAVHILAADQEALSNRFASKGADKFAGLEVRRNGEGVPLLDGCSALFQCRTVYKYEGGDHVIFVGEVNAFDHLEKPPLVFHGGRYAIARSKAEASSALVTGEIDQTTLGTLFARVYLHMVTPLQRRAEQFGLDAPKRYMLNVVMSDAAHALSEINAIIAHTGVEVTQAAASALVARGLVEAVPGDDGQRYRITDEGRQLALQLLAASKALEADALGSLSEGEQGTLHDLLTRLVAGLAARAEERAARNLDPVTGAA